MNLVILFPLLVTLIGLIGLAMHKAWLEILRICFFVGLLVLVAALATGHLHIGVS
jgi:hypothetical protein